MRHISSWPDWVLAEASRRAGVTKTPNQIRAGALGRQAEPFFFALCDMVEVHERPPPDRKLLCVDAAIQQVLDEARDSGIVPSQQDACIRAIELWEEGFGK